MARVPQRLKNRAHSRKKRTGYKRGYDVEDQSHTKKKKSEVGEWNRDSEMELAAVAQQSRQGR